MSKNKIIKKNILIVLSDFVDPKQRDFFNQLKKFLDERQQNHVYFYFLTPQAKLAPDCFSGSVANLRTIIKRRRMEVVVIVAALRPAELQTVRSSAMILAGINTTDNSLFDFSLQLQDYTQKTLIHTAQQLSVVDKLNWDTDFFGINIARLNHRRLTKNTVKLILAVCRRNRIKCLYYTADTNDPVSVQLAEANGFHFTNIRVTYQFQATSTPKLKKSAYIFRRSKPADLPALIKMSKNLYRDSRYYFDKNFSDALCDKLYTTWVKKLAKSKNKTDRVYVVADKNQPVGYLAAGVEFDTVYIFLVGVDLRYQGQGIGKLLMSGFIADMRKRGFNKFEVVTQGRNIGSQRLYQSYGFKITASDIDYHKWF